MPFRPLIVALVCCSAALSGCSKKTAAELAEEERVKLREEKRRAAAEVYGTLAKDFPDHEKAKEAAAKAQALSAAPGKK